MTKTKNARRGALKLFQVHYQAWAPPVIVAARSVESAAAIAIHGIEQPLPPAVIAIDATDDFRALSDLAAAHVRTLITGGVEGVVELRGRGWLDVRCAEQVSAG